MYSCYLIFNIYINRTLVHELSRLHIISKVIATAGTVSVPATSTLAVGL